MALVFIIPPHVLPLSAITLYLCISAEDHRMQGRAFFRKSVIRQQSFVGKEIERFAPIQAMAHAPITGLLLLSIINFMAGVIILRLAAQGLQLPIQLLDCSA